MKPNKPKPPIRAGDILPCYGGPLDGQEHEVGQPLFPWLPDLIPAAVRVGKAMYILDRKRRRWVYNGSRH